MRKVEEAALRVPGVVSARANLSARRVTVTSTAGVAGRDGHDRARVERGFVAAELSADLDKTAGAADRDFLRRVGVAGFAAANIMLLSVSVWSAPPATWTTRSRRRSNAVRAFIALPAIAYAGQSFFRSAARAIRARRLNMDVPISLGDARRRHELYQTVRGSEQVYFDAAITLLFFRSSAATSTSRCAPAPPAPRPTCSG